MIAYLVFLIIIAIVFLLLFITHFFKKNSLTGIFAHYSLFSFFYLVGYIGMLLSNDLNSMLFFQKIMFLGGPFLLPVFTLFLIRLRTYQFPERKYFILLFFYPIVKMFLAFTNDYHNMYFDNYYIENFSIYSVLVSDYGPLYYLDFYYLIIMGFTIYNLVKLFKQKNKAMKNLIYLLIISFTLNRVTFLISFFDIIPKGFDIAPIFKVFDVIAFLYAIYFVKIFDIYEVENEVEPLLTEGLIYVDKDDLLISYNMPAKRTFDELNKSYVGLPFNQLKLGKEILNKDENNFIYKVEKNNIKYYYLFSVKKLDSINKGKVYLFTDFTDQYNANKRINFLASHDGLTGIYNQVSILEKLEVCYNVAKDKGTSYAVFLLDIDEFKTLNDTYGHLAGNDVLVGIANILKEIFKDINHSYYGRFGGDEFVATTYGLTYDEVNNICDLIKSKTEKFKHYKFPNLKVKTSVGACYLDDACIDDVYYMDVVEKADLAMYESKKNKSGVVSFIKECKINE